jgi:flagellar basal-body rod protein FlgB
MFSGAFGRNLDMVARELDVSVLRRGVIANNIANSDVPNFKRSVVNFEAQLKRAVESENRTAFPARTTRERHIEFDKPMDWRAVQPRRILDYLTESKNNGNNVDMEEEGMDALNNQLSYTTLVTAITSEFQRVNLVLR